MKTKILIKKDQDLFIDIAVQLKQFIPFLNELKSSFEGLEIGVFTNQDYKKIILLGHTYHIDLLKEIINKRLISLKIFDLETKEKALNQYEKQIERFKKSINNLKVFNNEFNVKGIPTLPLKFISFQNQLFVISKEDKEMILDTFCKTYLETPEEIKLYEASKKLSEAFNEYLEFFNSTGIPSINKHYAGSHVLKYDENSKKMVLYLEGIKAVATYKKRKSELNLK